MKGKSTWILLRGLSREVGHWGNFVEDYRQAFPEDDVLALDLPGVGEFRAEKSPLTVSEIAAFVRAKAIDRVQSPGNIKLFSISLGSMVAMEWIRSKPEDLASVVMCNTSASDLSPMYMRMRWQIWPKVLRAISLQQIKEREKRLIDVLINDPDARERALPIWVKIANEHPLSYVNLTHQLWAASRFQAPKSSDVPVLLLSGLGDRLVDPSCSEKLHAERGWPLERHAWGGHDLSWDDPQWILSKVKAWNSSKDATQ